MVFFNTTPELQNYENLIIPRQNHTNHEIHRNPVQNNENNEILDIPQ